MMGYQGVLKLVVAIVTIHYTKGSLYTDYQCAPNNLLEETSCLDEELCIDYKDHSPPPSPKYYYEKYGLKYEHIDNENDTKTKIEAEFEPLSDDFKGICFNNPTCSHTQCKRRMLRIDLELNDLYTCSGPVFDIFNYYKYYEKNYYYGAKAFAFNTPIVNGLTWHTSKAGCCYNSAAYGFWPFVLEKGTKHVRIYVAHNYLRVITDSGFDRYMCDLCLFNLNNCGYGAGYKQTLNILINTLKSKDQPFWNKDPYPVGDCVAKFCLKWETCACDNSWFPNVGGCDKYKL